MVYFRLPSLVKVLFRFTPVTVVFSDTESAAEKEDKENGYPPIFNIGSTSRFGPDKSEYCSFKSETSLLVLV